MPPVAYRDRACVSAPMLDASDADRQRVRSALRAHPSHVSFACVYIRQNP
jgi:hypothetical protein